MPRTGSTRDDRPEALTLPPAALDGHAPLAARLRPRTLEEFVGQAHLVGDNGALRRLVERGHLGSMVLWGPPGSGKTTLARLLADAVGARFATLSAVMSGVADVRALIADARDWLDRGGAPTVLFIDEIHRFNKAQQDALLPQVEDGTITLIGATTENPYFEVNSALLSRTRVYRLEPLEDLEVRAVVERSMVDERGFGGRVSLAPEALDHVVGISGGAARAGLKSNRAGLAYWAAMADVQERGSLPVPLHLRNAPVRGMRAHGIGVGYRYPHDYEGADVAQQYLPDAVAERRYYAPSGEGLEARIGERLDRLREARAAAAASGEPQRSSRAGLPKVDPMRTAGGVMKARQGRKQRLAEE